MEVKTVLCIDGGGTCGFFSHQILKKLVLLDMCHIDLVVGVSAGAIVGALFAIGLLTDLDDVTIQLYTLKLFDDLSTKGPWFGPKYKGVTKSSILQVLFGDRTFGDVHVPMAILVDRIENSAVICRSWDPLYRDIPLAQLLDATSAVPVLFPPVTINGEQYIDGGTVTGSPICIAYLVALDRFTPDPVRLISIGTSRKSDKRGGNCSGDSIGTQVENDEMGIVQLISLGLPLKVLRQSSVLVNELVASVLGPRFVRIEGAVFSRLDDVSIYVKCQTEAEKVWSTMESSIVDFLERTQ
jgi:predicted acylesterase/phospholipase RssA